ncbi:putative reverse transcriptase domain-containing protein [Tanacetum coccineum]
MQFLGHLIDSQGLHVDPAKIEAVKNWASPTTPTEVRQFLGLVGYYRRFIQEESDHETRSLARIACRFRLLKFATILEKANVEQMPYAGRIELKHSKLRQNVRSYPIYWYNQRFLCGNGKNHNGFHHKTAQNLKRTPPPLETIWGLWRSFTNRLNPTQETGSMDTLTRLYIKEIISWHGVPISIISDRNIHFTSRFWQSLQSALGTQLDMSTAYHPETMTSEWDHNPNQLEDNASVSVIDFGNDGKGHLPLVEFSYNNSYHASIKATPLEALYGRKCRSPIC